MTNIDWNLLAQAMDFYERSGFQRVDVPWTASREAIYSTLPVGANPVPYGSEFLVGSAEQSFIDRRLSGELSQGRRYVTCTPCFRQEPVLNELYQPYFMKVELVVFSNVHWTDEFRRTAFNYFDITARVGEAIEFVRTDIGWDIELNGIEIGSYGFRTWQGLSWTYGTGLALPRFTVAMQSVDRLNAQAVETLKYQADFEEPK